MDLADHIRSLELALLTPSTRNEPEAVTHLLAEEFREFGSSGRVFGREEIVALLRVESSPSSTMLRDFECRQLAPNLALATYRTIRAHGSSVLRSSIWICREERWQLLFHQGTRIETSG